MHACTRVGWVAFSGAVWMGCAEAPVDLPSRASKEAQAATAAELDQLQYVKVRFRRNVTVSTEEPTTFSAQGEPADPELVAAAALVTAEIQANLADSDWPVEPEPGKVRMIAVNGDEGTELEYEFDEEELAQLYEQAVDLGFNLSDFDGAEGPEVEGPPEPPAGEPESSPQGWSDGVDNRHHRKITASWPYDSSTYRRMGSLNNNCSAVAVGRRIVLTAAHCVVTPTQQVINYSYQPRRVNSTMPYSQVTTNSYWTPSEFVNAGCHIPPRVESCSKHDYAIMVLPENAFEPLGFYPDPYENGHPGWMGYGAPSPTYISNNKVLRNVGYPVQAQGWGAPSAMFNADGTNKANESFVPYEDANLSYGKFASDNTSADNPRTWRFSHDLSWGHSGGPVFSTTYPGGGPYVLGVVVWEKCRGACTGTDATNPDINSFPNVARSLEPTASGTITYLKAAFP